MSAGVYKKSVFSGLLICLAAACFIFASPTWAKLPKSDVNDVLELLAGRSSSIESYEAELHVVIQDTDFLKKFFLTKDSGNIARQSLYGYLKSSNSSSNGTIYLQYEANDYQTFLINNMTVTYGGLRRFADLRKNDAKYKDIPFTPAESKQEEKTPDKKNAKTPASSGSKTDPALMAPSGYLPLEPGGAVKDGPLAYVIPFILQPRLASSSYKVLTTKAKFAGRICTVMEMTDNGQERRVRMWIDRADKQILQVESYDPQRNCTISAYYLGFYPEDKASGFAIYNRVQVNCNGNPVFMAELTEPRFDARTKMEAAKDEAMRKEEARKREVDELLQKSEERTRSKGMSEGNRKGVIVLGAILAVLALRYILYRHSRQEFSDELIVIDEEDGRFAEMLVKMGYRTVPFSPDVIAEERQFLGKGPTSDTSYRPKAIVVAPDSFQFAHNHLYLIKAYVEEGGRVLAMYHPQKSNGDLPYKVEQVPTPEECRGLFFEVRDDILTNVKPNAMRSLARTYTGPETILKLNGRKFNERLIWYENKESKIESTVVGSVRQGKGEYIVCQMQFTPQATVKSANMQFMLNDIFRYLLGLEPIKTNHAQ